MTGDVHWHALPLSYIYMAQHTQTGYRKSHRQTDRQRPYIFYYHFNFFFFRHSIRCECVLFDSSSSVCIWASFLCYGIFVFLCCWLLLAWLASSLSQVCKPNEWNRQEHNEHNSVHSTDFYPIYLTIKFIPFNIIFMNFFFCLGASAREGELSIYSLMCLLFCFVFKHTNKFVHWFLFHIWFNFDLFCCCCCFVLFFNISSTSICVYIPCWISNIKVWNLSGRRLCYRGC